MNLLYNLSLYNNTDVFEGFENIIGMNGGSFSIKVHNDYWIINYNKAHLSISNVNTLGLWRSVILNSKTKEIVCFSPPKSHNWNHFVTHNKIEECDVTIFEEGTMCNLFWDKSVGDWEIATRGGIGGRYKYFKDAPKTFRMMFLEAMNYSGLEFNMLDKNFSYSFVLRHPDNRIVVPHKNRELVLTNVYFYKDCEVYEVTDKSKWFINTDNESNNLDIYGDIIKPLVNAELPEKLEWENLYQKYSRMDIPYTNVGIQIYNKNTSARFKLRNPSYEQVKKLKGNSPKMQFQYYNLRQSGKVKEFLYYYPEYLSEFSKLRFELHRWTNQLFTNYIECYIKKMKPLKEFAYQFKPHMYALHKLYIDNLRSIGGYITKGEVIKYVNDLHPAKLMHAINYPHRKNTIDIIKDKTEIPVSE